MICCDPRNPRAVEYHDALTARISERELPEDLVVAIGGDGFMLHTLHAHGLDRTYLGLNAGHLGFLLNPVHDFDRIADALRARAYDVHDFPVIQAHVVSRAGERADARAVNDVYLERATGQTTRLTLSIDGHQVVDALSADGLIFSTALGSTAYTFSAGGTPCHPALRSLSVTPICPHLPRLSPFVLPASARARVDVIDGHRRPVRAVADGKGFDDIASVELGLGGDDVHLAWFHGHDFTSHLVRKILHP